MKTIFAKILTRFGLALTLLFAFSSCYEEFNYRPELNLKDTLLYIGQHEVFFDSNQKLALVSVAEYGQLKNTISYNQYQNISIAATSILNNEEFDFGTIDKKSAFSIKILTNENTVENYLLNFTTLPIIQIIHKYGEIPDEPKGIAIFNFSDPTRKTSTIQYCGIERRGGSAIDRPKKSYSIELRTEKETKTIKKLQLLNMHTDENWILDATFIDKANTRNRVSFDIWYDIQNDAIEEDRSTVMSANKGHFIELFINNEYQGIYCLNECIDEDQMKMDKSAEEKGFIYKSEHWAPATLFTGLPDTAKLVENWSGWEQKYPDPDKQSCWKPLYKFINFVMNSTDQNFKDSIASFLVIDQAIDYYILMNLIKGVDNAGKNIFLVKQSTFEPFYICPWDMDATWGRDWQGLEISAEGRVSFKLFERLIYTNPDQYKLKLKNRWKNLRQFIITPEKLSSKFDTYYNFLTKSGAAKRENSKWPESLPNIKEEQQFINQNIDKRIAYLDHYFNNL